MVLLVAKSLVDWSWGDTWVVTGLGFGIVVVLLICLVFILQAFGWTMQRMTAPKAPKAPEAPKQTPKTESSQKAAQKAQTAPSEPEKAAIAMALAASDSDEIAAVAYALHLAHNSRHDLPTAMISLHPHETAWNTKSVGMNNAGF
ncbi:MAG: OadG family protein [Paludibacteraceae bacterium]|nr:OadG family protein [Paludibacteraceae bacterium]